MIMTTTVQRRARGFLTHKIDASIDECQDAIAADVRRNRYVVADGMTTTVHSRFWARALVESFIQAKDDDSPNDWGKVAKQEWDRYAAKLLADDNTLDITRQRLKMREASHATFVAATISPGATTGTSSINLLACGDACALHLRMGEIINTFPIKNAEQFSATTPSLSSDVNDFTSKLQSSQWNLANGDVLVMASDALAKWFMLGNTTKEMRAKAIAVQSADEFGNFVKKARLRVEDKSQLDAQPHLDDDDVGLLIVEIGAEGNKDPNQFQSTEVEIVGENAKIIKNDQSETNNPNYPLKQSSVFTKRQPFPNPSGQGASIQGDAAVIEEAKKETLNGLSSRLHDAEIEIRKSHTDSVALRIKNRNLLSTLLITLPLSILLSGGLFYNIVGKLKNSEARIKQMQTSQNDKLEQTLNKKYSSVAETLKPLQEQINETRQDQSKRHKNIDEALTSLSNRVNDANKGDVKLNDELRNDISKIRRDVAEISETCIELQVTIDEERKNNIHERETTTTKFFEMKKQSTLEKEQRTPSTFLFPVVGEAPKLEEIEAWSEKQLVENYPNQFASKNPKDREQMILLYQVFDGERDRSFDCLPFKKIKATFRVDERPIPDGIKKLRKPYIAITIEPKP